MNEPTHVPKLRDDPAAIVVHGLGDTLPALYLCLVPEAGRARPAETFATDAGGFGDDQTGGRSLRVISGHQFVRDRIAAGAGRVKGAIKIRLGSSIEPIFSGSNKADILEFLLALGCVPGSALQK